MGEGMGGGGQETDDSREVSRGFDQRTSAPRSVAPTSAPRSVALRSAPRSVAPRWAP